MDSKPGRRGVRGNAGNLKPLEDVASDARAPCPHWTLAAVNAIGPEWDDEFKLTKDFGRFYQRRGQSGLLCSGGGNRLYPVSPDKGQSKGP